MKTKQVILFILIVLIHGFAHAKEIELPADIGAHTFVLTGERNGLWEKTLIARFPEKRHVLSTNDGIVDVPAVANHAAHPELWFRVCNDHDAGGKAYAQQVLEKTAEKLGLHSKDIAMMSTAADMDNLAVVTKAFGPFTITALVTAGAKSNAIRTGIDEGTNIETTSDNLKPGTINIMLLTNARITDGGMARAVITATEAKTAALEDLKVPSTYTKEVQATGTGTDSMIIVSGTSGPKVTYTGGHSKIGELIGKAVYEAVLEALEKQNGFKKTP